MSPIKLIRAWITLFIFYLSAAVAGNFWLCYREPMNPTNGGTVQPFTYAKENLADAMDSLAEVIVVLEEDTDDAGGLADVLRHEYSCLNEVYGKLRLLSKTEQSI